MNNLCVVILPVYQEFACLTKFERISYRRMLAILRDRDIILVTNKGVNVAPYIDEAQIYNKSIGVKYFKRSYFKSTRTYNELLLSSSFYKSFLSYKYMLIYQLDAYVFVDNIDHWIACDYDYVGAPWFEKYSDYESGFELWEVGNGGLSLRKVEFYYRLLKFNRALYRGIDKHQGLMQYLKSLLRQLGFQNNIRWHKRKTRGVLNEDSFLTHYIKKITNRSELIPRIPLPKEAALFAFEKSPSYLYKLCGSKLPMGCHAFVKFEYETFWSKYIH